MPMQLYFKRAKSFVTQSENDRGTRKFLALPGPHPQPVPFWVAETETFKHGIKDVSIVNLTPPEQMPGYKYPTAPAVVEEAGEAAPPVAFVNENDFEQTSVPVAEFGAQPMTPVAPAPKVGGIRAGNKR